MTAVDPITRLNQALEGRYRIERQLGEGGMANVYLADDLRHERKVALKVLKPELAAVVGPDRFLAEIKTTAGLQHPHILPLHDSGQADGFLFYVMPYVVGESLRERLDREHQLPVEEAVQIARNVAEALDHAHTQGVIHRDIKPANILLQGGKAIVSDFGIALAVGAASGDRLTETGLSLGTPYYMSPEQATGEREMDARSDVYALACVLYEMLAGVTPFEGGSPQAVLTKVVTKEADSVRTHRRTVPLNVDAAIGRALEKVPADRFASGGEFAGALVDPGFRRAVEAQVPEDSIFWKRVAAATGVAALVVAGVAAPALLDTSESDPAAIVRFTVPLGEDSALFLGGESDVQSGRPAATSLAISSDGTMLVYSAWSRRPPTGGVESRLYLRRLDRERAEPIPGTEGASSPFFSPDDEWLAFFVGRSLRRMRVDGGRVETIVADTDTLNGPPHGGSWGDDGTIVYDGIGGVYRVDATGGVPTLVAEAPSDTYRSLTPLMLPESRAALFTGWEQPFNPEEAAVVAVDLESGKLVELLRDAMDPSFVESGHLLFTRRGTLMAVRFDPDRLQVIGEPFLVLEDVMQAVGMNFGVFETGAAQVAVSPTGHLAYATGGVFPQTVVELVRVRPDATVERLPVPPGSYWNVRVSPDGDRVAFSVREGRGGSIRIFDIARGVPLPIDVGGFRSAHPTWSPDGRWITFSSDREGGELRLYRMSSDGGGEPERLASSANAVLSWSTQGAIAFARGGDVWVLPESGEPEPLFTGSGVWATFSPDGRWLAYGSEVSGQMEVYVRPYPGPNPVTKVSVDGGFSPTWSPDGRRIHYVAGGNLDRVMMAATVTTEPDFRVERVDTLVDWGLYSFSAPSRSYDVFPDGSFIAERFVVGEDIFGVIPGRATDELHVVLNFGEELRQRDGGME